MNFWGYGGHRGVAYQPLRDSTPLFTLMPFPANLLPARPLSFPYSIKGLCLSLNCLLRFSCPTPIDFDYFKLTVTKHSVPCSSISGQNHVSQFIGYCHRVLNVTEPNVSLRMWGFPKKKVE